MASTTQRYISKELTHFVGKGLRPASQYKTLIKILSEGWLTHAPHDPSVSGNLVVKPSAKISQNEMYSPQVVCFCDIPVEDLTLHVSKYSRFGFSFDKEFIVQQGGAPVHYLPIKSKVKVLLNLTPEQMVEYIKSEDAEQWYKHLNKDEYFDSMVRKYHKLFQLLHRLIFEEVNTRRYKPKGMLGDSVWDYPRDSDGYPVFDFPRNALGHFQQRNQILPQPQHDAIWYSQQLTQLQHFLDFHIFSFLNFFDHTYPENHPDNFYFEREWRVVGNIKFNVEDVRRILIPKKYARQLRKDCPHYYGQLTFLD
ncbi:abortive infection system antitoxin AbiGi family protein [Chloroflexota bacterium]